jgi:single-stranded DNA-binding protein
LAPRSRQSRRSANEFLGTLFRPPEQRTSKNGNPFVTATLKAKDGDALQWWKVIAFSESVQTELMRLGDGDALSVQGALKVETYEKDGATKLSLSVVADHVLAQRQPPKPRELGGEKPPPRERGTGADRAFDDAIPY